MINMIVERRKYGREFESYVHDIIIHPYFKVLKHYRHHGIKRFDHSVTVGYYSFLIAKKLHLDERAVARGALLHDFFYDKPIEEKREIRKMEKGLKKITVMQGYTHPEEAAQNAQKFFDISELEEDIISKHMFPLTPEKPAYKESWIVNGVDTTVAVKEMVKSFLQHPYWTMTGQINTKLSQ